MQKASTSISSQTPWHLCHLTKFLFSNQSEKPKGSKAHKTLIITKSCLMNILGHFLAIISPFQGSPYHDNLPKPVVSTANPEASMPGAVSHITRSKHPTARGFPSTHPQHCMKCCYTYDDCGRRRMETPVILAWPLCSAFHVCSICSAKQNWKIIWIQQISPQTITT